MSAERGEKTVVAPHPQVRLPAIKPNFEPENGSDVACGIIAPFSVLFFLFVAHH
jgi:hypothetical protein